MTSVEQQLDTLRSQFTEHSERRIAEMRQLLAELQTDPANSGALHKLRVHFHSFAGMGTTYGHPEATALGDRGEGQTLELLRKERRPTRNDLAGWAEIVDALSAELEA